jgi:predicted outer membrane repeat protein
MDYALLFVILVKSERRSHSMKSRRRAITIPLLALLVYTLAAPFTLLMRPAGAAPLGAPVACDETDLAAAVSSLVPAIIDLPGGCTIPLTADLPDVTSAIVINGNGAVINGQNLHQPFTVTVTGSLTLNQVTVQNGNAVSGGGIYNDGAVTITNSTLSGNSASNNGAIANFGTLTVTNSTFSGNSATSAGAIRNGGTLTITNSTFSGNSATTNNGGAIFSYAGTVTITNSTFSGNSATANSGGAIYNTGSTITLTHSTLSGNSATTGGGIRNAAGGVTLVSSIVANSTGGNCSGGVGDGGSNLQFGDATATCGAGITVADPLLGPLQNNGGPTSTFALSTGSPAIDAIPNGNNGCGTTITTDQRGAARPYPAGGSCDIGSFEVGAAPTPPSGGGTTAGPGGASAEDIARSQAPLCADLDGSTNEIVRAEVPGGTVTNGGVYCRVLDGNPSEIGNLDVINMGVIHAVDIFGMSGGLSVPNWNNSITACLQGTGRFFFLDALTAPRALSQLPATFANGYTCAIMYHAGTVVLVP